jgi:hypothetical protein
MLRCRPWRAAVEPTGQEHLLGHELVPEVSERPRTLVCSCPKNGTSASRPGCIHSSCANSRACSWRSARSACVSCGACAARSASSPARSAARGAHAGAGQALQALTWAAGPSVA